MPRPTDAQKEAGNYAKHHIRLHGLPITIENRKGTVRSGEDSAGRPWSVVMPYDYGYIKRTVGADGDHVDVFLGPNRTSQFVVVVNQHEKQTGRFEEIKVGLGYLTLEQAKAAYHQGYRGRHVPRATFKTTTVQRLKEWLRLRQTWTQFDLSAAVRLTNFGAGMKKPAKQDEKPSVARRVAGTLGAGAAIAGFYRYSATRPDVLKRNYRLKRAQVTADPTRKARLGNTAYVQSLKNQPAPTKTPAYSGGDKFDYGVVPKPPSQPAAVKRVRGAVIERNVVGKTSKPKPKAKVQVSTKFSARLALIQFQERNRDGTMGVSTSPLTAYRKASRVVPWVGRAGQAAGDIGDIATGKKVKDPFYKKPWFKRAVTTAAIGVPLLAANLAHSGARKNADGVPVRKDKTFGGSVDRLSRKAAAAKERLDRKLGLSAKLKPVLLQAVVRHVENFDYASDLRGWDLRDPRGRSARVYAPGSKRRERREKTWSEKTDNIRLVRNIAIAGAIGAGGAALHYRNKANRLAPKAAAPTNVVPHDFRKVKQASAVVRSTDLASKDEPVGIHGLIDATKANLPGRPELPGEGVAKHIANLPPKKRRGLLRILGAGTLAAGGALGGTILKRPRTGALVGGLGAGYLLG